MENFASSSNISLKISLPIHEIPFSCPRQWMFGISSILRVHVVLFYVNRMLIRNTKEFFHNQILLGFHGEGKFQIYISAYMCKLWRDLTHKKIVKPNMRRKKSSDVFTERIRNEFSIFEHLFNLFFFGIKFVVYNKHVKNISNLCSSMPLALSQCVCEMIPESEWEMYVDVIQRNK